MHQCRAALFLCRGDALFFRSPCRKSCAIQRALGFLNWVPSHPIWNHSVSTSALPLIDITGLRGHDPVAQHLVAEQLRKACVQHGFFYITGHGIDPELIASVFAASQTFFDLPMAEKLAVDKKLSVCNRGYEPLRAQTLESGAPPGQGPSKYWRKAAHHPTSRKATTSVPRSLRMTRACAPSALTPAPTSGLSCCPSLEA